MAAISGFFPESPKYATAILYTSSDLDEADESWAGVPANWLAGRFGVEALARTAPVSVAAAGVRTGYVARNWFADYYHRVHVVPPVLDIGNLLSVQTRDAHVWNAHLTDQALASIGEDATEGLTESGIAAPTTFAPLEERVFSVTVDTAGPATIGALYTFVFPSESPTLGVTGRRVVVFGYPPNWSKPVVERLAWLTDVLPAHGGTEQRIGLRAAPRRALEYSLATLDRRATARLETLLLGWQSRLFAVPVWTDLQVLAAPLPAGSTVLPCDTADYEFAADGLALLWRAYDDYEAVEVESVGASSLTLRLGTVSDWPAGTRLYPIRLGRLPARQAFLRETGHHLVGSVAFAIEDNPGVEAADSGDTYAGYRVYLGGTNWAEPTEIEAVRQLEILDYDTGAPWVDDLSGLATLLKTWHWLLKGRGEIVALRGWLAARAGRRVPFWSATQAEDLEVLATIGSSDSAISVGNIGYARYLDGRADRRHIVIETLTGARYYRAITAASEVDDDTETLAIDSPLGVSLLPSEIRRVRFLHLVRLDSDEIELVWHTATVAECSTMLRSLPQ